MAIQPLLGSGGMWCRTRRDTPDNKEDAGMVGAKGAQNRRVYRLLGIAKLVGEIIVNPGEGTRRVSCEMGGSRIGCKVVIHGNLAALIIIIADETIIGLIVLLQPGRGRVPIFHLRITVIERHIVQGKQEQTEGKDSLDQAPADDYHAQTNQ